MKIPSPQSLGLPEKFSCWRPQQENALGVTVTSKKRSVMICAPTGSGKSALAVGIHRMTNKPTLIVTFTKGLAKQYLDQFGGMGLVELRGKRTYQCALRDDYSCEEGYAARCPFKGTVNCEYSAAEMAITRAPLGVTNYAKWTHSGGLGQAFQHFKQVIFDEAHEGPGAISEVMRVTLHHREIEETLGVPFLVGAHADDMSQWKDWAKHANKVTKLAMLAAYVRMTGTPNPKATWVRHYCHMRNLARKLTVLELCKPVNWVVDQWEDGYQFDPIRPAMYAESALLFKIPKLYFLTATGRPKTMYMMGQAKDSFDFIELDSDFDPKRGPIYYVPTMRVDYRTSHDLSILWSKFDRVLARRRNVKGLIQTVSFERQKQVVNASRFNDSMIYNAKGEITADKVREYIEAGPGAIMVSPSISTGYSFDDDLARFNILCKIPTPPPSKILKARMQDDPEYRSYQTVQALVQAWGRIIRSKSDWGEGFIFDEHMDWFWPKNRYLAPRSFRSSVTMAEMIPPPLGERL